MTPGVAGAFGILPATGLAERIRKICMAVMEHRTPGEAARALGVFPSEVYRALKRLRPVFERRNLNQGF